VVPIPKLPELLNLAASTPAGRNAKNPSPVSLSLPTILLTRFVPNPICAEVFTVADVPLSNKILPPETCSLFAGFVVPTPTLPVEGLKVSLVLETPTFVETPEVTSSNTI
jgi:hypothetical protein